MVLEAFLGPRPKGMVACHIDGDIDNNSITNLRWDTQASNIRDTVLHGNNFNATKVACKRGHPFTLENTYVKRGKGGRQCRKCMRLGYQRRKLAKAA